jgi:hypothetical protein
MSGRQAKTYDVDLELKDAGLVAASAAAQVDSVDQILNLGTGTVLGDIIIDVSAMEVASDDEKYIIHAEVSSESDFASDIYAVCSLILGSAGTAEWDNIPGDTDMYIGRYVLPFRNEIRNGTPKQYMRLYTEVSGTVATGINYTAYLSKRN